MAIFKFIAKKVKTGEPVKSSGGSILVAVDYRVG